MASILVVSAHPDDETLFAGGTLAMFAQKGNDVYIYTHRATRLALSNDAPQTSLLSWSAWYQPAERERILNRNDRTDIMVDTRRWRDAKVAAALCHKTQHAMFLRNTGAPSVPAMIWFTETFHIWQGPLPEELQP